MLHILLRSLEGQEIPIVSVEDGELKTFSFSSLFYFILFLDLELEVSMISYITTTNYHICYSNHSLEWHLWYADFSKILSRLSSSGDYKRTRQGALAALLFYLYKYNVVRATTISTSSYVYVSTSCPLIKATMPYTCALTSYS